jgi:hypothetical protein
MSKAEGRAAPKLTRSEDSEQADLILRAKLHEHVYPVLELLHHVPNGEKREKVTKVKKDGSVVEYSPTGKKLKRQGVKAGVLDLDLPSARRGYFGLRIEMKIPGNDLTEEQQWWKERLEREGYRVEVCFSAEAAWKRLLWYIEGPPTRVAGIKNT